MMDTSRTTHFTFSGAVQLPGVTLPAGTYTFEVVNPNSGSDVVSVTSRDRSKVYLMQFTRTVYRPSSAAPSKRPLPSAKPLLAPRRP